MDGVSESRRSQRPGEDRWSVNEILEHLSLVEQRFAAIIAKRIAEARSGTKWTWFDEANARCSRPTLRQMLTDSTNRRTAPEPVQPRGGLNAGISEESA